MKSTNTRRTVAVLPALLLIGACAMADDDRRGQRRGPPPEAFEACAEKVEGDVCGFTGRRGTAEGICEIPRGGEDGLICAPEHGRGGPDRQRDDDVDDSDEAAEDEE